MSSTRRHFICPDDIWANLKTIAATRGELMSQTIRQALREYVARHDTKGSDR